MELRSVLYTSWVVAGGVRLLWYVLSHAICSLFVLWRIKTSEISGKVIFPPFAYKEMSFNRAHMDAEAVVLCSCGLFWTYGNGNGFCLWMMLCRNYHVLAIWRVSVVCPVAATEALRVFFCSWCIVWWLQITHCRFDVDNCLCVHCLECNCQLLACSVCVQGWHSSLTELSIAKTTIR